MAHNEEARAQGFCLTKNRQNVVVRLRGVNGYVSPDGKRAGCPPYGRVKYSYDGERRICYNRCLMSLRRPVNNRLLPQSGLTIPHLEHCHEIW